MSTVNYDLKNKGVRLVDAHDAWIKCKNGNFRLNPKYHFVGKIEMSMPNVVITVKYNMQPSFKGDFNSLNIIAKNQTVKHFYDEKGKRNKKTVAYFGISKEEQK